MQQTFTELSANLCGGCAGSPARTPACRLAAMLTCRAKHSSITGQGLCADMLGVWPLYLFVLATDAQELGRSCRVCPRNKPQYYCTWCLQMNITTPAALYCCSLYTHQLVAKLFSETVSMLWFRSCCPQQLDCKLPNCLRAELCRVITSGNPDM